MKYIAGLWITWVLTGSLYAQELIVKHTFFVGGKDCYVTCHDMVQMADGGFVFTGKTRCNGSGDIPPTAYDVYDNVVVGKIDSKLQLEWVKLYGGSKADVGEAICNTLDGGIAVLASTLSHNGDVNGFHGDDKAGGDIWLIRLDAHGRKLWSMCYGSTYDETGLSVATTPDSGFIILGTSRGYGDDVPFHYGTSQFVSDWFLVKVDKNGNKQWTKTLGGNGDDGNWGGSILVAGNGYYLVSSSSSTDFDCTDDTWHPNQNTQTDYYVLRLDTAGNVLWNKSFGGSKTENAQKALMNADSSIVIVGHSYSEDFMVDTNYSNGRSYEDVWVTKVDKQGNFIWGTVLGGYDSELGQTISKFGDGYAVYSNTYSKKIAKIPETWMFILDGNGKLIADKLIGGNGNDVISSVHPFEDGLLAAGYTTSDEFTDGTRSGNDSAGNAFFSKLHYFPASIASTKKAANVLRVTPNPAGSFVNIDVKMDTQQPYTVTIHNNTGAVMRQWEEKGSNSRMISTTDLQAGNYIVTIRSGSDVQSAQFVIER